MRPAVTFSRPPIERSSVVLPQPDGPDQHHELALADREDDVVDGANAAGELLRHVVEDDLSHRAATVQAEAVDLQSLPQQ